MNQKTDEYKILLLVKHMMQKLDDLNNEYIFQKTSNLLQESFHCTLDIPYRCLIAPDNGRESLDACLLWLELMVGKCSQGDAVKTDAQYTWLTEKIDPHRCTIFHTGKRKTKKSELRCKLRLCGKHYRALAQGLIDLD